ncbi:hypothetical protein DRO59_02025 [Candidatus Bathyarchaeota archaeon]|nr:MAG: hypothetical protein DRO59_02025 [Candidatus Bathyarchaeota archaeon]
MRHTAPTTRSVWKTHEETRVEDPFRALGYLGILAAFCVVFSLTWIEVCGLGPSTVAKQLVASGMQIPGYRRSGKAVESILKRYIPAVTVLVGVIVGLIAGGFRFLRSFRLWNGNLACRWNNLPVL